MKIEDIKDGDELWVFDRAKDRYTKRTINVSPSGTAYFMGDPVGYFKIQRTHDLRESDDVVTDAELPDAKKRHAARRKAEKAAEAALIERVASAKALAERLHAAGIGEFQYGGTFVRSRVRATGHLTVDITPEQAEILLAAVERSPGVE